jgi:hypothetical protein
MFTVYQGCKGGQRITSVHLISPQSRRSSPLAFLVQTGYTTAPTSFLNASRNVTHKETLEKHPHFHRKQSLKTHRR